MSQKFSKFLKFIFSFSITVWGFFGMQSRIWADNSLAPLQPNNYQNAIDSSKQSGSMIFNGSDRSFYIILITSIIIGGILLFAIWQNFKSRNQSM
ncbi:MAG: hypothetical protein M1409_02850 [Actinobacteria bacterium]|nr:hypothetical protein [Actinomycetota bacterium]